MARGNRLKAGNKWVQPNSKLGKKEIARRERVKQMYKEIKENKRPKMTYKQFISSVLSAANATKTGRFGDNKVFISHVYNTWKKKNLGVSLEEFKKRLVEKGDGREILSRADLAPFMNQKDVKSSSSKYYPSADLSPAAEYHFIRANPKKL